MRMLVGPVALLLSACAPAPEATTADKPVLGLVTTLPLMFAPTFSLEGGSLLVSALEERYEVRGVAATDADSLAGIDQLLMAHALPQTAENLVALDEWVRGGGEVVLLADPQLEWNVGLPLGHPQAPPYYFGDTGLLAHWGLSLEGPFDGEEVGGVAVRGAGRLSSNSENCAIEAAGLAAMCSVGEGRAFVIADADFLDADPEQANVLIMDALERLAR
ncbi:GldG family protein [Sphingomicrobium clamense]|uniref:GldG family protein n=1 Tax=Sphingomicrobium clamense TaxID=2851013 RepID=A0ABS6V4A0_9SPHN|nr:GldG family protein [Sphingomicrobium sp. B8]MBW0144391.1 GldG family protein [Sphingomicrobium sp. B8]